MTDLFAVIAEIGATIGGFAGLFVAFAAHRRQITDRERYALLFLLFCSLGAALLATLPFVLNAFHTPIAFPKMYCAVSGAALIAIGIFSHAGRRGLTSRPRYPWVRLVLMPVHWTVVVVQLLPFLLVADPYATYALALWWLLMMAAIQFVMQIAAVTHAD
ncbi:MAG: hypothetical protein OES38_20735 [Gammaproteobacteria bacterium]|nr:hypothetical protein [Gammaproteobacteria bacterium]